MMNVVFENIRPVDVPTEHPIRAFEAFWRRHSKDDKYASWSSFEPMTMPEVLPWMIVLDCLPDDQYSYRLFGSGCERLHGINFTGKMFGQGVDEEWAKSRLAEFSCVKSGNGPSYAKGTLPVESRDYIKICRAIYGFSVEPDQIDRLLIVMAPQ